MQINWQQTMDGSINQKGELEFGHLQEQ